MTESANNSDTLQSIQEVWSSSPHLRVGARAAVTRMLELIEATHQISGVPKIVVKYDNDPRKVSASFRPTRNASTGLVEKAEILLAKRQSADEPNRIVATLLHELGHAIDMLALGNREFLFSSETHLLWNDWRKAVFRSEHVMDLRRMASRPPCRPGVVPPEVDYLFETMAWRNLQLSEIWARSYAQYIAARNNEEALLKALRDLRDTPDENFPDHWVPRQWSDQDFAGIRASMDALFVRLGWQM